MQRFLIIMIAAIAVIGLAGCGDDAPAVGGYAPSQTTEAYAYTHGGYIGQAVVSTDAEGAIDVSLNEAFLPHTLAAVDIESDEWTEENTVFYVSHGRQTNVAKYVSYNDTVYVGTTFGTGVFWVEADENGEPAGATGLEKAILRNQTTMAEYWDAIAEGAFAVYTEFGGSPITVTTTSYGSLYKRGSSYWDAEPGWLGNITAIEEFIEENGAGYSMDEITRRDDGRFSFADAVSSATASDTRDYVNVAQTAIGRLKMQ